MADSPRNTAVSALVVIRENIRSGRIPPADFPTWRACALHVVNSHPVSPDIDRAFADVIDEILAATSRADFAKAIAGAIAPSTVVDSGSTSGPRERIPS